MRIAEGFTLLRNKLSEVYEQREATSIARYLLEDIFNVSNIESDKKLTNEESLLLEKVIERGLKKEPWQHIVGFADFYGLKMKVTPAVLIPRPETEELVYRILQDWKKNPYPSILDIGTGTGCIPITLKKNLPNANIHAIDISPEALEIAQFNSDFNEVLVHFHEANILDNNSWQTFERFDVIVSNPPYIPEQEKAIMQDNVLNFEPNLALFVPDAAPLLFYEAIAEFGLLHLKNNGHLYFEIHHNFGKETAQMLIDKGFQLVEIEKDMNGKDRIAKAIFYK